MSDMHILSYAFIVLGVTQLVTVVNYAVRPRSFFEPWLVEVFRLRGRSMKVYFVLRHVLLAVFGCAFIVIGSPLAGNDVFWSEIFSPLYWPVKAPWLLGLLAAELAALFTLSRIFTGRIVLVK